MNPRTATFVAGVVGACITVFVGLLPFLSFAYRAPLLHVMLDTAAGFIGLLVALLLIGRFRQRRDPAELVIVYAMALFAFSNVFLSALAGIVWRGAAGAAFSAWATQTLRLIGALSLGVAPHLSRRWARPGHGPYWWLLFWLTVTIGVVVAVFGLLSGSLPLSLDPQVRPEISGRPSFTGHPASLAGHALSTMAFAYAVVGFLQRAKEEADPLMTWCAVGATLAAFSRVNYVLFPSLYSEWFYVGDVLRLGFYLSLLTGAVVEIRSYWVRMATAAVHDERRRMARELHDGVAQEVAFIASEASRLEACEHTADPQLQRIAAAAERALDESRRAIQLLSRPSQEPFTDVLTQTAELMAQRFGCRLELAIDGGVAVPPDAREALLRIMREAMTNAGRHGTPGRISVTLGGGDGITMTVTDDGSGFEHGGDASPGSFGLISMRERVEAFGGRLSVTSSPGRGTEVRAWLPSGSPS